MPYKNPEQKKAYQKKYHAKWYEDNKESRKKQIKDRLKKLKQKFRELKSTKSCEKCGESESFALDFHHVTINKRNNLSKMVHDGLGWESLVEEMEKCIILCSNCHRIEHHDNKFLRE